MTDDVLKRLLQVLLVLWFITASALVFVPSWRLLRKLTDAPAADLTPPQPPAPLELTLPAATTTGDALTQGVTLVGHQVKMYEQKVAAYKEQVAGYKAFADSQKSNDRLAVYKAVVTDALVGLLSTVLTTLLGFAFAKVAGQLFTNFFAARYNHPEKISRITIFG